MPEPASPTIWYTETNPDVLLQLACGSDECYAHLASGGLLPKEVLRRFQLFGCACARMVWSLLPQEARHAILIRERYLDGRASESDVQAAALSLRLPAVTAAQHALESAACAVGCHVWNSYRQSLDGDPQIAARAAAKALAARTAGPAPVGSSPILVEWHITWNTAFAAARTYQAELVRDIFPPPDRIALALRLEHDWLTDTVKTLVRHADETGEYGSLPILADALQDAGCDNDFILDRCRAPSGIHCRGNWVVDLLLRFV